MWNRLIFGPNLVSQPLVMSAMVPLNVKPSRPRRKCMVTPQVAGLPGPVHIAVQAEHQSHL